MSRDHVVEVPAPGIMEGGERGGQGRGEEGRGGGGGKSGICSQNTRAWVMVVEVGNRFLMPFHSILRVPQKGCIDAPVSSKSHEQCSQSHVTLI